MTIKNSIISIGLIAVLAGCIDSGGDDEADEESGGASGAERISFTGLVADGYLDGATVCLDINENKECDANDPTATSGEGGAFSITDATQAQRDQFPLLVEVVVGTTIDEDNAGVALTKPLTLTAPAGYGFISPLSTMVQNEVEGGSTASAAEEAVQAKLGTTLDLDSDYIEGKASGSNAEEYEQLHQVAQVTARVISDNMETLADAAAENNISLDDLISAIVDEVFDALDEIATEVEEIAADDNQTFDPDAVATEVNDELVDLAPETIEEQVEQNQAEEAATSVDMSQLLLAPGLTGFWAEIDMGNLNADYWTIYNNAQGDFQEDIKIWDSGSGAFVVDSGTPEPGYILKAAGWEAVANLDTPDSIVGGADGTITITKAGGTFIERLISTEVDLTGLNTRLTMNDAEDGDGIWGQYLASDAVFPSGSKGYTLANNGSDIAYTFEDWDDCEVGNQLNGICSFSYVQNGPVDGQAQTFAEITSATAYAFTDVDADDLMGIKGVEVAYTDTHKLWAEIVTGGAVNYYSVGKEHSNPDVSFLGESTWSPVSLNASAAIELEVIPEVLSFGDLAEDGNVILGLIAGYIRQGDIEGADGNDPQLRLLNPTAVAAVIDSYFSLDNLPVAPACTTGNTVWDGNNASISTSWNSPAEFESAIAACSDTLEVFNTALVGGTVSTGAYSDVIITYLPNGYGKSQSVDFPIKNYWFTWVVESGYSNGDLVMNYTSTNGAEDITSVVVAIDGNNWESKVYLTNDAVDAQSDAEVEAAIIAQNPGITNEQLAVALESNRVELGIISSTVGTLSDVDDVSVASIASAFDVSSLAGTYVWAASAEVGVESDADFVLAADGTGTVHWPADADDLAANPSHAGYNDLLEWHINAEGRMIVTLWGTVNNDGMTKGELTVERYTITAGDQNSGTVTLEEINTDGYFETLVSYGWTKQS